MSSPTEPKAPSSLAPRLYTGLVAGALTVTLILTVPPDLGFGIWLFFFLWAAAEFVRMARHLTPAAPLRGLWLWVPAAASAAFLAVRSPGAIPPMVVLAAIFAGVLVSALGCLFLASRDLREAALGMGLIAFAIPYFAIPPVAVYWLHALDRWLVFLLVAIVAVGDSLAYFVGRAFGRHPLAPRVSPKKTWEGSVAGFIGSLLAATLWCYWRLGEVPPAMLVLTAVTAVSAQLGDLVESVIKRGAGVKDSSQVLPGHGGFYDRLDAMMLAAPTFAIGLWWIGIDSVQP